MSTSMASERRTPQSHYHRAPPASTLLPADGGVPRAAAAVADQLGRVLDAHRADAAEVAACAAREPPAGAPVADAALRDLLTRTTALLARTAPAARLAERNPARAPTAPRIADEVLSCVDRKLDALETRLEVLYGLPRVVIAPVPAPTRPEDSRTTNTTGAEMTPSTSAYATLTQQFQSGTPADLPSARSTGAREPEQEAATPARPQPVYVSPPAPSTPQLEDFGIDNTALQGLTRPLMYHMGSARKPLAPNAPYEDVVQRSIEALHIQTPVQVAARFGSVARGPPSVGLSEAIDFPPTPPTVDLPEMLRQPISLHRKGLSSVDALPASIVPERTADPPRPRPPQPPQPLPDRRALSFDDEDEEKPVVARDVPARSPAPPTASALRMTRSRAKRAATEEAVDERYSKMANYLQSKFPKSAILAACDILHTLYEKKGSRHSVFILKDEMPGTFSSITTDGEEQNMLIYALSKLEIIVLRKERKTNVVCYEFGS